MKVEFYKHSLGEKEKKEINCTIDSLFLTTGPKTKEFEDSFAQFLEVDHCLGVTSWTMGNFITLKALGIGPGDKVLTTPLTYVATANTILHAGATPIFADVEPDSGNLDPDKVLDALESNDGVRAIVTVHLYGQMSDMKSLRQIASDRGIYLIEDCAHCVEGSQDGVKPGKLSDAAIFSFYATKNLTCGEGGAIVTNNPELASTLRKLRLHGVDTSAREQHKSGAYRHWDMSMLGYKCNMNDLSASLLIPQLPCLETRRKKRQLLCERYDELLKDVDGIRTISHPPGIVHAHHLYTIRTNPEKRDRYLTELSQRGIGVGVNFRNVHLMEYYRNHFGYANGDFPHAEAIGDSTISIPLYPLLRHEEQDYVADSIKALSQELEG